MAQKKKPTLAQKEEITDLVEADQAARDEAAERAQKCGQELAVVLNKHRCRIMPRIDPNAIEPVGMAGDKVQITATYWIAPLSS